MLFEIANAPDVAVVRCSGRIVQGDGTDRLLRAVMVQEGRHIEIDLSGVSEIDAGGLGVLVALERWARRNERTLQFVNPPQRVRRALEATRLDSVLQVRPSSRGRGEAA